MLTGAVLAGGQSRRYGKNKALETYDGKRLVDRNVEILRGFCSPVLVVAVNLEPFLGVAATLVADLKPGDTLLARFGAGPKGMMATEVRPLETRLPSAH